MYCFRAIRKLFVLGVITVLAREAYFKEPPSPPVVVPPPDPMVTWQPPVADATFSLNIRRNNSDALTRMVMLFALSQPDATQFVVLTDDHTPTEVRFYFTQSFLNGEKKHVTEAVVTNARHVHRSYSPPLLAQSP